MSIDRPLRQPPRTASTILTITLSGIPSRMLKSALTAQAVEHEPDEGVHGIAPECACWYLAPSRAPCPVRQHT